MRNLGIVARGLLLSCVMSCGNIQSQCVVTYLDKTEWGGRLGDQLIMYIKAKWVAFHYDLPFLYKPFEYSDQLMMHLNEQHLTDNIVRTYKKKIVTCYDESEIVSKSPVSKDYTFFQIHYYFNPSSWGSYQRNYDSQEIMAWPDVHKDKAFIDEIKKQIAPCNPISLPHLPANKISVAVHIRMGGGFDNSLLSRQLYALEDLNPMEHVPEGIYSDKHWPFKFPPLQYYVDQIKRLSQMFNDAPMYLSIYTDHNDPHSLMRMIQNTVNKNNISFDCRNDDNHHTKNVLEDMFAMAHYDCLIRSGSNYPQIAQLIGNHRVVIYPASCKWIGNTLVIDSAGTLVVE
jgi:hypothetical protein